MESLFNKVVGLKAVTQVFPVKFAKFLRTIVSRTPPMAASDCPIQRLTFLLTQLSKKIWLTVVSTDYVVRYFIKLTLGLVMKKFGLTLNRSLIAKLKPKSHNRY